MALIKCKECGHEISKKAETCPNCGAINKKKRKPLGFWAGILIIFIIGYFYNSYSNKQYQEKRATEKQAELQENSSYFSSNKEAIITSVNKLINTRKYKEAIDQIEKYKHTNDQDLLSLKPIAREKQLLETLKTLPASQVEKNLEHYEELLSIKPGNEKHKKKVAYYQKKVDAAEAKRAARIIKFGKTPIKDPWGGSYREVEKYLELAAHDPDSIDITNCSDVYHINTGWLVRCTYRGKNAFGGTVRNTHWFTIKHGAVTKQHEANAYKL